MSQYKIVIDSCGELPEDLKADGHFCTVPLLLDVDGYQITDDETFNQRDFLQRVKACIHSPKSSCPSPERYMSAYHLYGCGRYKYRKKESRCKRSFQGSFGE